MLSASRTKWLLVALAIGVPLAFAWFTGHAWEDYFITSRSSRNLAEGHGLVFNPGERVHTFTSPLGVLVPAGCLWLAGPENEMAALWLFRLVSVAALGGAVWLAWHRFDALKVGAPGRWLFFGLFLGDPKLVDFAINGMETGLLVFFALLLWSELEARERRALPLGLALAGLMWTRPDGFIIAAALGLPHLLFQKKEAGTGLPWSAWLRGALLGGLLYLPWFAWAWWYYGSPVPNTIVAKSAYTPPVHALDLLSLPWDLLLGRSIALDLYLPSYWVFGGWPAFFPRVAHGISVLAAFAWLWPRWSDAGRRLSLAVFLGLFYLRSIILFPWYVPPWTALASLVLAIGFDRACAALADGRARRLVPAVRIVAALVLAFQIAQLVAVTAQMRVHQRLVETGIRREIGQWLRQHAAPGDTVFLEPLGYIGYFSNLKTYDFPGLSSPEVVAAVRHGAKSYSALIARLKPTWVVLRPDEAARSEFRRAPSALDDYEFVRIWNSRPQLDAVRYLPGRPWSEFEAAYLLFHRKN